MITAILTGGVAGAWLGYVLQSGRLCFHSLVTGALDGRTGLLRGWALGVSVASVGLAVLYLLPGTGDLNTGLAFRPVSNVLGGLIIGVGLVVALSCVSGLFYKLGSGMLGAAVGLIAWAAGELVAREFTVPGPVVLQGGIDGTIPGLLGLPRLLVAALVLIGTAAFLRRVRGDGDSARGSSWSPVRLGLGLGVAVTAGWGLAALGGSRFGPSSVGAVASAASVNPNYWLIAMLAGITIGGFLGAVRTDSFSARGEQPARYAQLGIGGFLLGAGGWIAGGCTLGHGLSGLAQLNVSSVVVVIAIFGGVGLTRMVTHPHRSGASIGT